MGQLESHQSRPFQPKHHTRLLELCALLQWFDRELLQQLSDSEEETITALLASEYVQAHPSIPNTYCLNESVRSEVVAELRSQHTARELELQHHIFNHFLQQLQQTVSLDQRSLIENWSIYHLEQLFLLLSARREWQTINNYVAAFRQAQPNQPRTLHWLTFYEGFVALRTMQYERSRQLLNNLLEQPDLEAKLRMQTLNAFGQMHMFQSQYDQALAYYKQVYQIAQQINDLPYQGHSMLNMSQVYAELGYYEQAFECSQRSLVTFRTLNDTAREAHALYEIGNNAMYLGRWQIAQAHLQAANMLYQQLGLVTGQAYLFWCQGFLYHMLGDLEQSELYYLQALEIAQNPAQPEHMVALDALLYLGFLYQTQQRSEEAHEKYNQAEQLAQQLGNRYRINQIQFRRGNVFEQQQQFDQAYNAYQQAIEGIDRLRGDTKGEDFKIGLLTEPGQVYESMVQLCLHQNLPTHAFEYTERARSRAFLDLLASKSPHLYDTFNQPVVTLDEVQASLAPGTLLLEYFTMGVLPRGESLLHQIPAENVSLRANLIHPPRILIFAITHDRFEVRESSFDPNILRPQPADPSPIRRLLRGRLPVQLYNALLAPVDDLLQESNLLYIVPHGPLHYVPFAALIAAQNQLDTPGPAIALAPSATVLLRNCLNRSAHAATTDTLLALGFNDPDGEQPLRYAEAEAGHIARLLNGQAYVGGAPKHEILRTSGSRARWLHISGHAFYDPRNPLESELRTGSDESLNTRDIAETLTLDADLVTLSSCTSGIGHVVAGDEQLGLQRAFLYAGARAVLCSLWEAADFVALLLMDRFYTALQKGQPPAYALRDAQYALRTMTGHDVLDICQRWQANDPVFASALGELPYIPNEHLNTQLYSDPFWWAPFILIGKAT